MTNNDNSAPPRRGISNPLEKLATKVPCSRITPCNSQPPKPTGRFVLYWMTSARRLKHNFALQYAVDVSRAYGKPLLVLEALRCDYRWASIRFHRFVLEGMRDNAEAAKGRVRYYPYVERKEGEGKGLLSAFSEEACVVITDDYPCFHLPPMTAAAAKQCRCSMVKIDGNGVMPMRSVDRAFPTAYVLRRHLQKTLPEHLEHFPDRAPLRSIPHSDDNSTRAVVPRSILSRWPALTQAELEDTSWLEQLPIDLKVDAPKGVTGGSRRAQALLNQFIKKRLSAYGDDRNSPEARATSELSPYLHFGHVSAHDIVQRVLGQESWSPEDLAPITNGKRSGWWGLSAEAEGFLDQIVTWRELGFNNCCHLDDYDRYSSLPAWAQTTLAEHARDPREYVYSLEEFESAETHDPLWNAAQGQLVEEGIIHNYLRMLWGKKILEWTRTPQDALTVMIELNNKYALDGRDPNSYSGIFWVMGRHDRAWGPVRPVFGKVRFMSSQNTARKVRVKNYLARYTPRDEEQQGELPLG